MAADAMLLLLAGSAGMIGGAALLPDLALAMPFLMAGMVLGALALRTDPRPSSLFFVLLAALAARAILLPAPPATSDDLYRYLFEGRVVRAGENPYRIPPDSPRLADLRDSEIHPRINHPELPSIYLPVAMLLFATADLLGGSILAWKAVVLALELLAALALGRRALRLGHSLAPVVLYLWNPLLIVESGDGAHVDGAGAALLLLGHVHAGRRIAPLLAWASILVKPVAVLVVPFLGRPARPFVLVGGVLALLALASTAWPPEARAPSLEKGAWIEADSGGHARPAGSIVLHAAEYGVFGIVAPPDFGLGSTSIDGRALLACLVPLSTIAAEREKGGVVAIAADAEALATTTRIGRPVTEVVGRYLVAALGADAPLVLASFTFDAQETATVDHRDDGPKDVGYYADVDGTFVVYDRRDPGRRGRFTLSDDRVILRGAFERWPGLDGPAGVFGIKVAEPPLMSFGHYGSRWSGFALLHPVLVRLLGTRHRALLAAALAVLLLAIHLARRRATPSLAATLLVGTAIAFLPVIHPWYFVWPLVGAVRLERPRTRFATALLLGAGPIIHLL